MFESFFRELSSLNNNSVSSDIFMRGRISLK